MTLLFHNEVFLEHDTGPAHPECAARAARVVERIEKLGLDRRCRRGALRAATRDEILAVHDPRQFQFAEETCRAGHGYLDGDTPVSARSLEVALLAAGTALAAVDQVLEGNARNAFLVTRPPGHHATAQRSMGFCLFNNVALAARRALDHHEVNRVLIVDWDVHHGNGTQDIFYADPRVLFFSAHRYPFYPGTGAQDETGSGPGLGFTFNLPIRFGTPRKQYLSAFTTVLEKAADKQRPELVLVSAGFDAHGRDPIGSLGLETEDYGELTQRVANVAATHAQGRIVSLLEGGYNLDALAESAALHLSELARQDEPAVAN